jgi:hypothetical protein
LTDTPLNTPTPRNAEADPDAIRQEPRTTVEAAKARNLAKLRRAVIARLGEASTASNGK